MIRCLNGARSAVTLLLLIGIIGMTSGREIPPRNLDNLAVLALWFRCDSRSNHDSKDVLIKERHGRWDDFEKVQILSQKLQYIKRPS